MPQLVQMLHDLNRQISPSFDGPQVRAGSWACEHWYAQAADATSVNLGISCSGDLQSGFVWAAGGAS